MQQDFADLQVMEIQTFKVEHHQEQVAVFWVVNLDHKQMFKRFCQHSNQGNALDLEILLLSHWYWKFIKSDRGLFGGGISSAI